MHYIRTRERGVGHDEVAREGHPGREQLFEAHRVQKHRNADGAGVEQPQAPHPFHVLIWYIVDTHVRRSVWQNQSKIHDASNMSKGMCSRAS